MKISVAEEQMANLADYAQIPIAYEVREIMEVVADGRGGFTLSARRLDTPYVKDYDAIRGEGPATWPQRFNLSNWALFAAYLNGRRVGGAVLAFRTAGLTMLEGREDLAILWDIRVSPEVRGQGLGSALFRAAEAWAGAKGCSQLKVETQNVNVPACRFYEAQGCVIGAINRRAYPDLPDEVRILWNRDIPLRV